MGGAEGMSVGPADGWVLAVGALEGAAAGFSVGAKLFVGSLLGIAVGSIMRSTIKVSIALLDSLALLTETFTGGSFVPPLKLT